MERLGFIIGYLAAGFLVAALLTGMLWLFAKASKKNLNYRKVFLWIWVGFTIISIIGKLAVVR